MRDVKIVIWMRHTKRASRIVLFLGLGASLCLAQPPSPQGPSSEQHTVLDEALSWLPEDTETVMGASGVFPLTDANSSTDPQPRPYLKELALRVQTLPLALLLFENGGLSDLIQGKPVTLALEGSRRFRAPAGKGSMRYEGCEIVIFGDGVALDWRAFRQKAARSAVRFENVEGTEVAVFEERSGKDQWTTLVAFPRANVLLLATDRNYLQTVLSRMRTPAASRALPETLLEWNYVDTRATVWGLRHYQPERAGQEAGQNADTDPTSPFQEKSDTNVPDPDAVGSTFWFEPERQTVVAAYISINPDAEEIVARHLRLYMPTAKDIRMEELAPAVVQATAGLPDLDHFYNLMFGVMALMGHAVYL
jgi:hypothetical protein